MNFDFWWPFTFVYQCVISYVKIYTDDPQDFLLLMELVLREKWWDKISYVLGTDDCAYINSLSYLPALYFKSWQSWSPPKKKNIFCEIDGFMLT